MLDICIDLHSPHPLARPLCKHGVNTYTCQALGQGLAIDDVPIPVPHEPGF